MRKAAVYLSLFFLVGCLAWIASNYLRRPSENQPAPDEIDSPARKVETEVSSSAPIKRPEAELKRPPAVDDEKWRSLQLIRRRLLEENQPIEFYLRVLDQYGQPVSGALLTTDLTRTDEEKLKAETFLQLRPGDEIVTESLKLTSDGQGWIRFKGTGRYVFLGNGTLSKEGYVWTRPPTLGTLIFEPGKRRATVSVEMHNAFDPKIGYTLHLWKKGETEPLVRLQTGVSLPRPKTNAVINLFSGRVAELGMSGDLQIQVEFLYPNDSKRPVDRRIYLRGIGSSTLVETSEPYPYFAVETGYVSTLFYDVLPSTGYGPNGTWNWSKNFYVLTRGKIYGSVRVDFDSGEMNFGISGYLNPSGSRNLEADPEKQITNPEEIRRLDEATRAK